MHPLSCESIPLLAQITRLRFARGHALLSSLGLHPSQYHLLALLAKTGGLSQKEIAAQLYVKASTLTVMMGRLMRDSLVVRHKDAEDARIFRVHITDKGKKIVDEAVDRFAQIDREMFVSFTDEERKQFDQLAIRIRDNLVRATQGDETLCPWY